LREYVRRGEHGQTVFFVKRLQVADRGGEEGDTKIVPMMKAYTVFNVDQCDGLPDRVMTLGEVKARNPDMQDAVADEDGRGFGAGDRPRCAGDHTRRET
jgi:antirestriction protein ArdC